MQIKENVLLAPYTVFKIGGPARFFCEVQSKDELKEAVVWAQEASLPVFVLGDGSNILVSDEGFNGLVLRNRILGMRAKARGGFLRVEVGAGESWDKFVEFAVKNNASGVECLSGIPGSVGAAPVQNIGAYGQSVGETIESVNVLDVIAGKEVVFRNKDCEFNYRTSVFKKNPGKYVVTSAVFSLKLSGDPRLTYHDLKNYFINDPAPTLEKARQAVMAIRSAKGMVVKGGELYSSVGSFFMNPTVSQSAIEDLKLKVARCKEAKNCCDDPWFWQRQDGRVKVSAACLIEAGFDMGLRVGNTGISPFHSLAIVNHGGASASEILDLAKNITDEVKAKFDIDLEIEPQLVGFSLIHN